MSINNFLSNEKRKKRLIHKDTLLQSNISNIKIHGRTAKIHTMFTFQHSQITQKEFEQLAELLLKNPKVYATSKFDVAKVNSPFHLPLKPDAVFKKQRAGKVPIHLQDKVNRLLEILD